MTVLDSAEEYGDSESLCMLANLQLKDVDCPPSPPPRTPSPQPPPYSPSLAQHTFPGLRPHPHTSPGPTPTTYYYNSPSRRGHTTEWSVLVLNSNPSFLIREKSIAGGATQGMPGATVHAWPQAQKPRRIKKAAPETQSLVSGVPFSIFRGYATIPEAEAAFVYAQVRSWIRCTDAPLAAIPPLPHLSFQHLNPLNSTDEVDSSWYIVYCGIRPGVYKSHLESQLNTLGVRGSLHESVHGERAALTNAYKARYGPEAYAAYEKSKRAAQQRARIKANLMALEAYQNADDDEDVGSGSESAGD
ncbi:hypothetical protein B0H17DRAFT_1194614 [Mycena rosella]|uniref:Uncharacterized protein n=1 Tax=Mycena rosella TaxID=1033263 RepID=A0AAD7GRB7_MYCRO|nr:hypothetical protein B0H17DRAFT_1194614 [Mycena rosella]